MGKSRRVGLTAAASATLLGLGITALLLSIVYESATLAFIGLGLSFWGVVLLYVRDQDYVPKLLLDTSVLPSLSTVDQMIRELGFKGDPIYLPPKYFEDPETTRIYVARREDSVLPAPEEIIKYANRLIVKNPQGMLLTPPGCELTRLLEKAMETSFTKVDLKYLQKNMPKLFIEDLEIAENLELQAENGTIRVTITNPVFNEIPDETSKLPAFNKIGSPLFSAIACALTKATGEPITIEKIQRSDDGRIIEATYHIATTAAPEKQTEEALAESVENVRRSHSQLMSLATVFLLVCGSTVLAWIGWLAWYDMTAFGKSIMLVFLGSREGETISLGIGMRIIYYFLIGLGLLLSGSVMLAKKRAQEKKRLDTSEQTVEEALAESVENVRPSHGRFVNVAVAFLLVCGSTVLAWIGWLAWYDMTAFGKSITLVFFGSREGETISLGIGMRIIYYFLIGSALLLSGLIMLARKRRHEKKRLGTLEQNQAPPQ